MGGLSLKLKNYLLDTHSTLLPDYHKDPFDRLLIAQALNSNAVLVTRDKEMSKYAVETFWL